VPQKINYPRVIEGKGEKVRQELTAPVVTFGGKANLTGCKLMQAVRRSSQYSRVECSNPQAIGGLDK